MVEADLLKCGQFRSIDFQRAGELWLNTFYNDREIPFQEADLILPGKITTLEPEVSASEVANFTEAIVSIQMQLIDANNAEHLGSYNIQTSPVHTAFSPVLSSTSLYGIFAKFNKTPLGEAIEDAVEEITDTLIKETPQAYFIY